MFCAISGEVPEVPIISAKSGHVFEKRLIEKYIADNGTCPITGQPLTLEDLITVTSDPPVPKPRPPTMSSIPSMLSVFQNEWDSVMLETFTLKQQYQKARQELAHALYQSDASCRVIARLIKERDAARDALANVQAHLAQPSADTNTAAEPQPMATDEAPSAAPQEGMTDGVIETIDSTAEALSKTRKKRKAPQSLVAADTLGQYQTTATVSSLHSTTAPGITSLDIDTSGSLILTGGADHHVQVYQPRQDRILCVLKGHSGAIRSAVWRGQASDEGRDIVVSASADKTVRVWHADNLESLAYACINTVQVHRSEVTALAVHPSKEYFVSAGLDGTWVFHHLVTGRPLVVTQPSADGDMTADEQGITCAQFHPDGIILGTGCRNGQIKIWNVKTQSVLATFTGHTQAVSALAFSENGYYLASVADDFTVRVWDMRKQTNVHTIELDPDMGTPMKAAAFDYSGSYLAVGGVDVRIYQAKTWRLLATFDDNHAVVTGVRFTDATAGTLVASSMDRALRFYSAAG